MRDLPEHIEKAIRKALMSSDLTYEVITERAGVARTFISHFLWRGDDVRLSKLIKVLDVIGYEVVIRKKR